jgi:hypothetical protein
LLYSFGTDDFYKKLELLSKDLSVPYDKKNYEITLMGIFNKIMDKYQIAILSSNQ